MSFLSSVKNKLRQMAPQQDPHIAGLTKSFDEGFAEFERTGQTPQPAFVALIELYCKSKGEFNERIHQKIRHKIPPVSQPDVISGLDGEYTKKDFSAMNSELQENGYVMFEKKLSPEFCKRIFEYGLKTKTRIPKQDERVVYDPENPVAEIYRFDIVDMVNNKDIQELMMDPVLINVARNYLQCEPVFDFPAMWWSTSLNKEASAEAAQLYHFDMDRIKWLKIFFYINDVTMDNGPHCYIRGTHLPGSKPDEILQRGYVRVSDEELRGYYEDQDFKTICADAGSVFAGDTQCWHKGSPLKSGHRLVLEFEYTSSMFGANYPKLVINNPDQRFRDFCNNNKIYTSNLHLE